MDLAVPDSSPASLPTYVEPMLARAGTPFDDHRYSFELKWDGVRSICYAGSRMGGTTGSGFAGFATFSCAGSARRFLNSRSNSHTLRAACSVVVAIDKYQTCSIRKPGHVESQIDGTE